MPDENRPTITTPAELDALPVGSIVLDPHRMAWQKRHPTSPHDGTAPRWYASGVREGFERMAFPATVLHVPGRDLLAEARTTAVIPRIEISNPEQIRPFIAHEVAEAEARGYERGKRDALTEAADRLPALTEGVGRPRTDSDLNAETPGGGACVPIYTPGEVEDEENACVTHEGPWPCETPGGAA